MEERKFDLQKITKKLKKYLDEDRLWHTLGVMAGCSSFGYGLRSTPGKGAVGRTSP